MTPVNICSGFRCTGIYIYLLDSQVFLGTWLHLSQRDWAISAIDIDWSYRAWMSIPHQWDYWSTHSHQPAVPLESCKLKDGK